MSTPQAFWQTLLASMSGLDDTLTGTTSLLDSIYLDVSPIQAGLYQTINIAVPASPAALLAQTTNSTSADPVFNEWNFTPVPIVMNQHPQWGAKIRSFDQFNSPQDIKTKLLGPALKTIGMQANAIIANLITTTNFGTNTPVATTGSQVTPDQFVNGGYTPLLNQLVQVQDPDNMVFLQHPNVFAKQLRSPDWTQESLVGVGQAEAAKKDGALRVAYGARMAVDQQMPVTGAVGSRTFRSIYMSRYAIAAAFRPIQALAGNAVETTYFTWKGIPIRISFGASIGADANLLNVDVGMGCAVVRPEQAVVFSTA